MISGVLTDIAREIGYDPETIKYANTLTYKTLSKCIGDYERYVFVAALYVSARMKRNDVFNIKKLSARYDIPIRSLNKYKIKVLRANNIDYCGSFMYQTKKTPEIPKQPSFFDNF